ncbi:hypothetical protein CKO15_12795 [Halorhodospira abdelmalekii]|uniref:SixA phosphatase family protein n=1 Tax=Halorhodospira abdelmalekii TaxID=421629 RepID=UPI00190333AF|nr:histidine phosphatase family protein [Halorhodospira abdelmalekii]MBK1736132.1 hypothetical protein [Halorhodospira abdelmalekii]
MGERTKELLLIRHAKSSWEDPALADWERPLAPRGERAAPEMGRRLLQQGRVPEQLVSSEAVRARQTAKLLAEAMGLDRQQIAVDPRLYEAGPNEWLAVIRDQPDCYHRIALIGHNPALEQVARQLLGLQTSKVPTAAVIYAHLSIDAWAEADAACAELIDFDYPKRR